MSVRYHMSAWSSSGMSGKKSKYQWNCHSNRHTEEYYLADKGRRSGDGEWKPFGGRWSINAPQDEETRINSFIDIIHILNKYSFKIFKKMLVVYPMQFCIHVNPSQNTQATPVLITIPPNLFCSHERCNISYIVVITRERTHKVSYVKMIIPTSKSRVDI